MKTIEMGIVDGTGDFGNASYKSSMRHSFCRQLATRRVGYNSHYERGPSLEGYRVAERGRRAADFLSKARAADPDCRLMLAGYSRGASSVIMAAEELQTKDITVEAMFLFDPVARHASSGGTIVPKNVKRLYIVRRSLDRDLVAKYDHTIGPSILGLHFIAHNPMRVFFGGTAHTYLGNSSDAFHHSFRGSHGALGGVGWSHVTEDPACQAGVANWMNRALAHHAVPVQLVSFRPKTG